jgi:hypothetical protein
MWGTQDAIQIWNHEIKYQYWMVFYVLNAIELKVIVALGYCNELVNI